ncbi:hypothetical protein ACHAW5_006634 [Stephanodiscus triporus]|uniref:Signal recognition particle receptor subunit beta n=1 Tax=Stephanodiscus triporus TaxID=2934178 RepID=A0ABD3NAL2_9STRA
MKTAMSEDRAFLTAVRKSSAPYLPPPLLRFLHAVDANFHLHHGTIASDYFHDEPSMTIMSSLFIAYVVWRSARRMWTSTTRRSTAHLSGEEDAVLGGLNRVVVGGGDERAGHSTSGGVRNIPPSFRETVVLCGARDAGKTALLHRLCNAKEKENAWDPPMTVTSLAANAGYICPWEDTSENGNWGNMTIRIIDHPGHPSLLSHLTTLLLPVATSRVVFALDATQPVTEGAALLYQYILTHSQVRQSWSKAGKTLMILVVCTKSDAVGAKNHKRMKIQLRNELDKLRKVDMAITDSSDTNITDRSKVMLPVKGKSIDLDSLGSDVPVSLHFVESGFGKDVEAIREFVLNGALLDVK